MCEVNLVTNRILNEPKKQQKVGQQVQLLMNRQIYSYKNNYPEDEPYYPAHKTVSNFGQSSTSRLTSNSRLSPFSEHEAPTNDSSSVVMDLESVRQLIKNEVFNSLLLIKDQIQNKVKQMDSEIRSVRNEVQALCETCAPYPDIVARLAKLQIAVDSLKVEARKEQIFSKQQASRKQDDPQANSRLSRVQSSLGTLETVSRKDSREGSRDRKPIFSKSESVGNISAILFPDISIHQSKHTVTSSASGHKQENSESPLRMIEMIQNALKPSGTLQQSEKDFEILEKNLMLSTHLREVNHDSDDLIIVQTSPNQSPLAHKNIYIPPASFQSADATGNDNQRQAEAVVREELVKNKSKFLRKAPTSNVNLISNQSQKSSGFNQSSSSTRLFQKSGKQLTDRRDWRKDRAQNTGPHSSHVYTGSTIHEESCEQSFHFSASKPN